MGWEDLAGAQSSFFKRLLTTNKFKRDIVGGLQEPDGLRRGSPSGKSASGPGIATRDKSQHFFRSFAYASPYSDDVRRAPSSALSSPKCLDLLRASLGDKDPYQGDDPCAEATYSAGDDGNAPIAGRSSSPQVNSTDETDFHPTLAAARSRRASTDAVLGVSPTGAPPANPQRTSRFSSAEVRSSSGLLPSPNAAPFQDIDVGLTEGTPHPRASAASGHVTSRMQGLEASSSISSISGAITISSAATPREIVTGSTRYTPRQLQAVAAALAQEAGLLEGLGSNTGVGDHAESGPVSSSPARRKKSLSLSVPESCLGGAPSPSKTRQGSGTPGSRASGGSPKRFSSQAGPPSQSLISMALTPGGQATRTASWVSAVQSPTRRPVTVNRQGTSQELSILPAHELQQGYIPSLDKSPSSPGNLLSTSAQHLPPINSRPTTGISYASGMGSPSRSAPLRASTVLTPLPPTPSPHSSLHRTASLTNATLSTTAAAPITPHNESLSPESSHGAPGFTDDSCPSPLQSRSAHGRMGGYGGMGGGSGLVSPAPVVVAPVLLDELKVLRQEDDERKRQAVQAVRAHKVTVCPKLQQEEDARWSGCSKSEYRKRYVNKELDRSQAPVMSELNKPAFKAWKEGKYNIRMGPTE